ncbi:MAG: hypothetical protein ACLTBV_17865 [Enterocloster bolteae]
MPEEWVGSMVEASNPGMEPIAHEGLAVVETADGPRFLRDIIDDDREFYLALAPAAGRGWRLSFLLKILDSAMRLHVQAHPSTRFANEVMGMPYGKLECYYILHVRDGISPYIRLGFQHTPGRDGWRKLWRNRTRPGWTAALRRSRCRWGRSGIFRAECPTPLARESLCWKLWSHLIWWCGVNSSGGNRCAGGRPVHGTGAGLLPGYF